MKKILYPAMIYFMMGLSAAAAEEVKLTTIIPHQDQVIGASGVVGNGYGSASPYNWNWRTASPTTNQFYVGGNVGIGTTSPIRTLDICSPTISSEMVMEVGDGKADYHRWNFVVNGGTGNAQAFSIRQLNDAGSGGNVPVCITGDGKVQIANTSFYTSNGYQTIDANTGYGIINLTSPYEGVLINGKQAVYWSTWSPALPTLYNTIWRKFPAGNDQIIFSDYPYGNGQAYSDIRLKKDIVTIPDALERLQSIRGVNFRWKKGRGDNAVHAGMIAQEVEKVFPEVVQTGQQDMKLIEYDRFMGVLVEAVKDLKKDDDELKRQTKSLADRVALLEKDK